MTGSYVHMRASMVLGGLAVLLVSGIIAPMF
jgi:hypothetical protein